MVSFKIIKHKYSIFLKASFISLLITILCTFNIGQLYAQILIGPKAGARVSWMQYEDFDSDEYKKQPAFGYSAGITTAFKVKKRFLLQLDIMYTQTGKKIEGITDPSLENHAKYHYLNTPVVYKLDFKEAINGRAFKWYIGAGPNVNFWLGGKGTLKAVELKENNTEELDYKIIFDDVPAVPEIGGLYIKEPNKVQVGLIASTGLVLEPAPGQSIMIDLRYEWGHSYMAREDGKFTNVIAYEDNLRMKTHSVQLSVAYVFDIINKGKKEKRMYYEN